MSTMTKLAQMVNPQVMAPMISAKLPREIKFSQIAKIDTTLVGQPGSTITVPSYSYVGAADDYAEGSEITPTLLKTATTQATIKQVVKGIELTSAAIESGYGDPVGEAINQLTLSIADKIDDDCYAALQTATLKLDSVSKAISYEGIVEALDKFEEEADDGAEKIIFVHPKQITQLRKDPNFLDINKYPITNGVIMSGLIGSIAGCKVVRSKRVKLNSGSTGYENPIVITGSGENELSALTIYVKKEVNVVAGDPLTKLTTFIRADSSYTVTLTNPAKVVLATFKK